MSQLFNTNKLVILILFISVFSFSIYPETDPDGDDDGDGLTNRQEYEIWLTNPQDSDTDGDGWTDFQESQLFDPDVDPGSFNPLVADMPRIEIILKSEPQISMEFESSEGKSQTISTERSREFASSHTRSRSSSRTSGQENSFTKEVSVTAEVSVSLTDFGGSLSTTASSSRTSTSYSEDSYTWGSDTTRENREAATRGRSMSQDSSMTFTGGEINYAVAFSNPSGIGYEVESMTLTAYRLNPRNPLGVEMIGTLSQETAFNTFQNFVIPPYTEETAPMSFENGGLYVSDVLSLLEDSTGLMVALSGYKLTMDGKRFDSQNTMVTAKTARINLDFDGKNDLFPETYQVSVKTLFNPDYRSSRDMFDVVTLEDVLSYLYIDPARSANRVREYNYFTDEHNGNHGIVNLRGVESSDTGYWVITHNGKRRGREFTDFYSTVMDSYYLDEIEVMSGDMIDIFYVEDKDGDGLSSRKERMLGSSDENPHSDNDGIDDYHEYLAGSSPVLEDTDQDGYPDNEDPAPAVPELLGSFYFGPAAYRVPNMDKHSYVGEMAYQNGFASAMVSDISDKKYIIRERLDSATGFWYKEIVTREDVAYVDFLPVKEGYLVCGSLPIIRGGMAEDQYPGYIALYSYEGVKLWSHISSETPDWSASRDRNYTPIALAEAGNGNYYMLTKEKGMGVWEIDPRGNFLRFSQMADQYTRSPAYEGGREFSKKEPHEYFFFEDYHGSPLLIYKKHLFHFKDDMAEYRNFESDFGEFFGRALPRKTEDGKLFVVNSFGMDGGMSSAALYDENLGVEWQVRRSIGMVPLPGPVIWEEDGTFKVLFRGNLMHGDSESLYMVTIAEGETVSSEKLDWKLDSYSQYSLRDMQSFGRTFHGGYLFGARGVLYYTNNEGNMPIR